MKSKKQRTDLTSDMKEISKKALPKLENIKLEWDLQSLFYKGITDAKIEADAKKFEKSATAFTKKYQPCTFTKSDSKLYEALTDYELLMARPEASRILRYLSFRTIIDVNDTAAQRRLQHYSERFRKLSNNLLFFELHLGKVPKNKQKQFLAAKKLAPYHYYLHTIFTTAQHNLSEEVEKVLQLRQPTSRDMWEDGVEKIVSNRTIKHGKKTLTIPAALEELDLLPWSKKQQLWDKIIDACIAISEFAEHELTAIVTHQKVTDELRSFAEPYSATALQHEMDETAMMALIDTVSKQGFAISRRYHTIKAKLHKTDAIPYAQRYTSIGTLPRPTFAESVEICREAIYGISSEYGHFFDGLLQNGHIDVYPKQGKQGGGFMASGINVPTLILLNHVDNIKSLETLAHEVGHAVHSERSKQQSPMYQNYSTAVAETASTFFEQLILDSVISRLDEKQLLIFLHDKIGRDIASIQRQIALCNFELKMHHHIRQYGLATREELAQLMQKELQRYLGPAVSVSERDGYSYVYWSHIRNRFYAYTYAFGHLLSGVLADRFRADAAYAETIDGFFSAGGSDTVANLFSRIDIDIRSQDVFVAGLQAQKREVAMFEKLCRSADLL